MLTPTKNKPKLLVTCDVCGEIFEVNFKEKNLTPFVKVRYFKCPHCKKVYTVGYFNSSINKMIREGALLKDIQAAQDILKKRYGVGGI